MALGPWGFGATLVGVALGLGLFGAAAAAEGERLVGQPCGAPADAPPQRIRARSVIGADGGASTVGRQCVTGMERVPYVFAYHEIIRSPAQGEGGWDGGRCDA